MRRVHRTQNRGVFSYEPVRVHEDDPVARRPVGFGCPRGHAFTIMFADDAELPIAWECRQHGIEAGRLGVELKHKPIKVRTHWDMLRERRAVPELEQLLDKQLETLRAGRLVPVGMWLRWAQGFRGGQPPRVSR